MMPSLEGTEHPSFSFDSIDQPAMQGPYCIRCCYSISSTAVRADSCALLSKCAIQIRGMQKAVNEVLSAIREAVESPAGYFV